MLPRVSHSSPKPSRMTVRAPRSKSKDSWGMAKRSASSNKEKEEMGIEINQGGFQGTPAFLALYISNLRAVGLQADSPFLLLARCWVALALDVIPVMANVAIMRTCLADLFLKGTKFPQDRSCCTRKFIPVLMYSVPSVGCSPPKTGCSRILRQLFLGDLSSIGCLGLKDPLRALPDLPQSAPHSRILPASLLSLLLHSGLDACLSQPVWW